MRISNCVYGWDEILIFDRGSRNIEVDTALTLWTVALAPSYPIVTEVVEFVNVRAVFISLDSPH